MFTCILSLPSTSLNNALCRVRRLAHKVSSKEIKSHKAQNPSEEEESKAYTRKGKDSKKVCLSRQAETGSPMQYI